MVELLLELFDVGFSLQYLDFLLSLDLFHLKLHFLPVLRDHLLNLHILQLPQMFDLILQPLVLKLQPLNLTLRLHLQRLNREIPQLNGLPQLLDLNVQNFLVLVR